jgi:hypothetical protein
LHAEVGSRSKTTIVLKIIEVSATAQKQSENNPLKPKVVFKDAQGCAVTMQNLKVKEMFNGFAYLAQHRQDFLQTAAGGVTLALPARQRTAVLSGPQAPQAPKPSAIAGFRATERNTLQTLSKTTAGSLKICRRFRVLANEKGLTP